MARYGDTERTKGRHVRYIPGEPWRQRHERRKRAANDCSDRLQNWAQGRGVSLTITNEGHHYQFRRGDHRADWWPSSAKLVLDEQWRNGIHVHDYQAVVEILEERWLRADAD